MTKLAPANAVARISPKHQDPTVPGPIETLDTVTIGLTVIMVTVV